MHIFLILSFLVTLITAISGLGPRIGGSHLI